MKITLAGITFDNHHYDERGDVLSLSVGEPQAAAHGLETPGGHGLQYDENWVVTGLTLLNVRWSLDRDGEVTLTSTRFSGASKPACACLPVACSSSTRPACSARGRWRD